MTRHFTYGGVRLASLMRQAAGRIRKHAQEPKLLPLFDECHYGALRLLEQLKRKTGRHHYYKEVFYL